MSNTYNFLNSVWKNILTENNENRFFIPFLALFITVPLFMGLNNVALGLLILSVFAYRKQLNFQFSLPLLLPIVLFLWMCVSYFWSIDTTQTLQAIPKEIALIIVPIIFLFIPRFSTDQHKKIVTFYSYSMVVFVLVFLVRAGVRFLIHQETSYFFYHGPDNETDTGLVPKLLNAIHVSVYVALAFFHFFIKEKKSVLDKVIAALLFCFVLLLSSKNIIFIFIILLLTHVFFYSKIANKMRLRNIALVLFIAGIFLSIGKIRDRFLIELQTNTSKSLGTTNIVDQQPGVNYISIADAWSKEHFEYSDYFPGTALRVYQIRLFTEFLDEEPIFWKGFGLNASKTKLLEKEKKYNLYPGYGTFNFHNQYVQNFAELGFVGFILLLLILFYSTKYAFRRKDFMAISFSILMISLFLTESFLWRQRGVTFFIVVYCLFIQNNNTNKISN
jgi:O-antigen ligase